MAGQVIATNVDFATAVENDLGVSAPTTNEVDNILRWMTAEEPTSDWFDRNNPLNNGFGSGGGGGLGTYPNLATAAQDVAANLTSPAGQGYGYGAIVTDLRTDASPDQFSADVEKSSWAGSRYGSAASGAPPQYIVAGRTPDYIAGIPVPKLTGGGDGSSALPGTSAGASVTTGSPASATEAASFPGGALDPLNLPSEIGSIFGGVEKAGGGAIASGLLGVIDAITAPLKAFVEDSALVVIGIIVVVVGLVVLGHAVTSSPHVPSEVSGVTPAGMLRGKRPSRGGGGGAEGDAEEAGEALA